jgi:uncharacterized SAM-binding protein YcdF (DUF218 family)
VLGVIVVLAALTARLFVWPPVNSPQKADAILVMAGDGPRVQNALALVREGYAPLLVVSGGIAYPRGLCGSTYYGARVICFVPQPYTTQGEAEFFGRLAEKDHLDSVIVVSGRAQTVRARLRLTRCFNGKVLMDPAPASSFWSGAYLVFYEWGALLKALTLQRSC